MTKWEPGLQTTSGYLTVPPSGSGPGVLVLHAWWGLNPFFVALCDRLAQAGFVALAPDLYGGRVASTIEEAEQCVSSLDWEAASEKVQHALDALGRHPALTGASVGTVAFSLGASWAFLLSTQHPEIAATVIFYGLGPVDMEAAHGAYLGHFAEADTYEPVEQVRALEAELRRAGKDATFHVYPSVGHWFFEDDRPDAYDAPSAQLAWERTVSFLQNHVG